MQINSFCAFFKLLMGKCSLSIYLTGVKIANYYPVILKCDGVSSGSDQFFLDDCSLFSWCSNLFLTCPNSVK